MRSSAFQTRPPRAFAPRLGVCAALVAVIGAIDYATGLQIRIFPLYFAPVAYMAAGRGAWPGIGVAIASTVVWLISSLASGNPQAGWLIATNATLQLAACVVIALIVARMRRSLNEAEAHARRDALTGLANRRALAERAGVELARVARGGGPLVVAHLDLDDFKAVNDRDGHSAGDRLLRAAGQAMKAALRAVDLVARTGGDEFVLLLPDIDPRAATAVLERVRAQVAGVGGHATATVGAVVLRAGASVGLEDALGRADAALYTAKRAGKDRVVLVDVGPAGAPGETSRDLRGSGR